MDRIAVVHRRALYRSTLSLEIGRVRIRHLAVPCQPFLQGEDRHQLYPVHLAEAARRGHSSARDNRGAAKGHHPTVGYLDTPNFIRKFKKETGYTPGQYRKMFAAGNGLAESAETRRLINKRSQLPVEATGQVGYLFAFGNRLLTRFHLSYAPWYSSAMRSPPIFLIWATYLSQPDYRFLPRDEFRFHLHHVRVQVGQQRRRFGLLFVRQVDVRERRFADRRQLLRVFFRRSMRRIRFPAPS